MKKIIPIIFIVVGFLLVGCEADSTPGTTGRPAAAAGASTTATPFQPDLATPTTLPDANVPGDSPTNAVPVALTQTSGTLTVQIFSEADVDVSAPQYDLSGQAPAGTVISINDDVLVVDSSQVFKHTIPLEEGPNLVEIVASNAAGDQVRFEIIVSYSVP